METDLSIKRCREGVVMMLAGLGGEGNSLLCGMVEYGRYLCASRSVGYYLASGKDIPIQIAERYIAACAALAIALHDNGLFEI